jgi:putative ABC transport system permease protein
MTILDLVRRAGRSLRNAKARTILTSLAIAVGAFTLTITLAAGNGIRAYTDRLIANNFDPTESIVGRDKEIENTGAPNTAPKEFSENVASMSVGGDGSTLQLKQITDEDIEAIKKLSFVEQVRPNYQISVRYITREGQKKYTLSAQVYNPGQKPELAAGSLSKQGDIEKGSILLPNVYMKTLGFKSEKDALGKEVQIVAERPFSETAVRDYLTSLQSGMIDQSMTQPKAEAKTMTFKIIGVTKPGAAAISVGAMPVLLSDTDARELYDFTTKDTQQYGKYIYAFVRVKGGADAEVAAQAKAELKKRGYFVQTSQDIQKTITQLVDILQILVAVFGVITVIASVFGIVNTMYISVLERTREIGLMKALGMRGKDVSWLFRIEAAWIGFLGGVIGAAGAFALGVSLNPWLTNTLGLGKGNSILIFDFSQIAALILILIAVAIVAGYLPARKAAKLDPIEALRTE